MSDRQYVETVEPRAELMSGVFDGKDRYWVEFPYGGSTAIFSTEERAWKAARELADEG